MTEHAHPSSERTGRTPFPSQRGREQDDAANTEIDLSTYPALQAHRFGPNEALTLSVEQIRQLRDFGDQIRQERSTRVTFPVETATQVKRVVYACSGGKIDPLIIDSERYQGLLAFYIGDLAERPKLPELFAFKGGIARKLLAQLLRLNMFMAPPRDCDIAAIGNVDAAEVTRISMTHTADDFRINHRHGVERCKSPQIYFENRDITINELLVFNELAIVTPLALVDLISATTRLSRSYNYPGKLFTGRFVRLLQFAALCQVERGDVYMPDVNTEVRIPCQPFDVALNLAKAFARSPEVARVYLRLASQHISLKSSSHGSRHKIGLSDDLVKALAFLRKDPKCANVLSGI